jgi:hypothetical protein
VVIALAQLGRFRLSSSLPNGPLLLALIGFFAGLALLIHDGTTDPTKSWKVFGPWFFGGLACAFFSTRVWDGINTLVRVVVWPGAVLASPLTKMLSEMWPRYPDQSAWVPYRPAAAQSGAVRAASVSYRATTVRSAVARAGTDSSSGYSGAGLAVSAGTAFAAMDMASQFIEPLVAFNPEPMQDINPVSGLPTIAGMGSPDIAANTWCTVDHTCPDVYYEAPFDCGCGGFSDF